MNHSNVSPKTDEVHESPDSQNPSTVENPSPQHPQPFRPMDKKRRAIAGAIAELDLEQMRILQTKTPAERVQMGASMMEAVERVGAFRLRQREPELSEIEALRIVRGGLMNYMRQKNQP